MRFVPLFDVRIKHSYYTDGRCSDFVVEPTPSTRQLLKNHRLVAKSLSDGIRVLAGVDDGGRPFVPISRDAKFTFHLRLHNADFPLFTDLADVNSLPAPLYTNAVMDAKTDKAVSLMSRTAQFRETLAVGEPAREEHFILSGIPAPGLGAGDFVVESVGRIDRIEQYDVPNKTITVNTQSAARGAAFTTTYAVRPKLDRGVFADVEILVNDTLPQADGLAEEPREFQIVFEAKKARWVFYCITDRNGATADFRIIDTASSNSTPPLVFGDDNRTDLLQDPDPSDVVATGLAEQYPELSRLRFVSDALVPCRQAPRAHIELHANGQQLSRSLPNPSVRNYSMLQVKADEIQDAFFHVVKYLSQSFSKTGV